MSTGVWVFLGLVVLAIAIFRSKGAPGAPKAPVETDLGKRFEEKDALAADLAKECASMAMALPIVDLHTSRLFHDPVYDAKNDLFDPPCKEQDFEYSSGRCWTSRESLPEVFRIWADHEAGFKTGLSRPRTGCVVPASDHIDVITCPYSINEPGLFVVRVSRVAEDRWHVHHWTCGLAPGASTMGLGIAGGKMKIVLESDSGLVDPPLKAVDVALDPSLWTRRNETVRDRWAVNAAWREAARLCTHKPEA